MNCGVLIMFTDDE